MHREHRAASAKAQQRESRADRSERAESAEIQREQREQRVQRVQRVRATNTSALAPPASSVSQEAPASSSSRTRSALPSRAAGMSSVRPSCQRKCESCSNSVTLISMVENMDRNGLHTNSVEIAMTYHQSLIAVSISDGSGDQVCDSMVGQYRKLPLGVQITCIYQTVDS